MSVPRPTSAQTYTVTDLGDLGGGVSSASGINNSGQVVGWSNTGAVDKYGNSVYHAFRWDSTNGMVDAGKLKGDLNSKATAVNDSGAMAGISSTAPVQKVDRITGQVYYVWTDHAVTWSSGLSIKKLATADALGINNNGEVVGTGSNNAILWSGNSTINLGTLGGSGPQSAARGINAGGRVVGYAPTNDIDQTQHAFLWTPTSLNGTTGSMQDLGTLDGLPGFPSGASAVNASGQVVGWTASYPAGGNSRGFLYSAGTMFDLGTLTTLGGPDTPSTALGINVSGEVVGYAGDLNGTTRAWVWVPSQRNGTSGQIADLNGLIPANSGWVLTSANGINDAGQIVGTGAINGQLHAFLLTPQ
jgi:probable HAF family extracellular repeat protein